MSLTGKGETKTKCFEKTLWEWNNVFILDQNCTISNLDLFTQWFTGMHGTYNVDRIFALGGVIAMLRVPLIYGFIRFLTLSFLKKAIYYTLL